MGKSITILYFFRKKNTNNSKANTNDRCQPLVLISQLLKILKKNLEKLKSKKLILIH